METPAIVRIAGLSNSNGNPIEKRWDAELPKSQTWDFIKRRIPGNLGGMGMVSMVVPYLI